MLTKILYLFADQEYSYKKKYSYNKTKFDPAASGHCFPPLLCCSLVTTHRLYFLYTQVPASPCQLGFQLQGFTGTTFLPWFSFG